MCLVSGHSWGVESSLGKQPGAGGANWIQLFGDSQGMMFTFPDWIFQMLQKLGAKIDRWTPDTAGSDEATAVGFQLWMIGPTAGQTAEQRPRTQWQWQWGLQK